MGIGMALHEESVLDLEFGDYINHDFASYHIPTCATSNTSTRSGSTNEDPHVNPMGAKGIGEIGIVGTAAAVANAVRHATGVRITGASDPSGQATYAGFNELLAA